MKWISLHGLMLSLFIASITDCLGQAGLRNLDQDSDGGLSPLSPSTQGDSTALIDHLASSSQKQQATFMYVAITASGLIISLITFTIMKRKRKKTV
jgi:hypothetical protein